MSKVAEYQWLFFSHREISKLESVVVDPAVWYETLLFTPKPNLVQIITWWTFTIQQITVVSVKSKFSILGLYILYLNIWNFGLLICVFVKQTWTWNVSSLSR